MAVGLVTEAATNNIRILAILRPTSTSKDPVDFMTIVVRETIPPHLAERFSKQTPTCGAGESLTIGQGRNAGSRISESLITRLSRITLAT